MLPLTSSSAVENSLVIVNEQLEKLNNDISSFRKAWLQRRASTCTGVRRVGAAQPTRDQESEFCDAMRALRSSGVRGKRPPWQMDNPPPPSRPKASKSFLSVPANAPQSLTSEQHRINRAKPQECAAARCVAHSTVVKSKNDPPCVAEADKHKDGDVTRSRRAFSKSTSTDDLGDPSLSDGVPPFSVLVKRPTSHSLLTRSSTSKDQVYEATALAISHSGLSYRGASQDRAGTPQSRSGLSRASSCTPRIRYGRKYSAPSAGLRLTSADEEKAATSRVSSFESHAIPLLDRPRVANSSQDMVNVLADHSGRFNRPDLFQGSALSSL